MDTTHLKYLLTIAQCHSISQAAEQLHLQRSYLSKIIATTERNLGERLFKRTHKGVSLTPAGEWFFKYAQQIVQAAEIIERGFNPSGEDIYPQFHDALTLYALYKEEYFDTITMFKQHFPNVKINLGQKNTTLLPLIMAQAPDDLMIGFHYHMINVPGKSFEIPTELTFIPIHEAPLVALASHDNPLAAKYQTISLTTLAKQDLIVFGNSADNAVPLVYEILPEEALPNIHYTTESIEMAFELLRKQLLFTLSSAAAHHPQDIREIPLRENVRLQSGLLFHNDTAAHPVGKGFINAYLSLHHQPLLP